MADKMRSEGPSWGSIWDELNLIWIQLLTSNPMHGMYFYSKWVKNTANISPFSSTKQCILFWNCHDDTTDLLYMFLCSIFYSKALKWGKYVDVAFNFTFRCIENVLFINSDNLCPTTNSGLSELIMHLKDLPYRIPDNASMTKKLHRYCYKRDKVSILILLPSHLDPPQWSWQPFGQTPVVLLQSVPVLQCPHSWEQFGP